MVAWNLCPVSVAEITQPRVPLAAHRLRRGVETTPLRRNYEFSFCRRRRRFHYFNLGKWQGSRRSSAFRPLLVRPRFVVANYNDNERGIHEYSPGVITQSDFFPFAGQLCSLLNEAG